MDKSAQTSSCSYISNNFEPKDAKEHMHRSSKSSMYCIVGIVCSKRYPVSLFSHTFISQEDKSEKTSLESPSQLEIVCEFEL